MITPWTREDDRLIAEKVEGWSFEIKGMLDEHAVSCGFGRPLQPEEYEIEEAPRYTVNLNAAMRAANHWSRQEPDHRGFYVGIDSCHDAMPEANFYDDTTGTRRVWWSNGESYAEAIARGLKKAVIGK